MKIVPKLSVRWTIKKKIGVAFVAMSATTLTLGLVFANGASTAGRLVTKTYDEAVNTTMYARAASADFASMRAELAHGLLTSAGARQEAMNRVEVLDQSFREDLATAVDTSHSAEIEAIAGPLSDAESRWILLSRTIGAKFDPTTWNAVEEQAHLVERGVEAMVGKVAADGFAGRQAAQHSVTRNTELAFGGMTLAILICGTVAYLLTRRISTPLNQAARFAEEIARGKLDGDTPNQGSDEIGDLNRAMISMRRDIRLMMEEQAVLQAQSQARVAEALNGSSEGVVVVEASGAIQLVNAKALDILGLGAADIPAGVTVDALIKKVTRKDDDRSALLLLRDRTAETTEELLADGRWIQTSRNRTAEGGMVALYTDVTAIRAQRDALVAANFNLDGALANMSQGLAVFDAHGHLTLANPQFYTITGLSPDVVCTGAPYEEVIAAALGGNAADPTYAQEVLRLARLAVRRRRQASHLFSIGERFMATTHAPMPEGGWLVTLEDVTERRHAENRVAFLATHDDLTQLPNRTLLATRVDEAIARARRGTGFAIHCLDLDHFKQVNDTLGHAVGDALLQEVTGRLRACVGDGDTVARLGGDEFAVLQSNVGSEGDCSRLARHLIESLSAPYSIQRQDVVIGVSIGIARAPQNGLDHGKLLKSADAALYKAKEEGRGKWHFFEDDMEYKLQARRLLENDLRQSIANNELEVYYQPLLDVQTREIRSFEALLRWNHPTKGLVSPTDFISVAEETGFINEIGQWVLRTACAQTMQWPSNLRIAVNVSAVQLRDPSFTAMVRATLEDTGLAANRLEIEITESAFMMNKAKVAPQLLMLQSLGIHFAMDDFGTGYSSLSNLRSFPFGKIKIDRSFVGDLGQTNGAEEIIRTILMLGKTLGMQVTAEGVETRKQLKFLEEEGCDTIQGYLVGRPMPVAQVPEMLAQYNSSLGAQAAA